MVVFMFLARGLDIVRCRMIKNYEKICNSIINRIGSCFGVRSESMDNGGVYGVCR